jgi:N-acetylmuramoyl-L-alanine amidase
MAASAALALACPARAGEVVAVVSPPQNAPLAESPQPITQVKPATEAKPATGVAPTAAHILRTRFIVGLERKVDYQIFSLSNPNRVVVELPDVNVRLPTLADNKSVGLVKTFRAGLAAPGKTRIVIDVTHPSIVESSKIVREEDGQFRLALVIRPADVALNGSGKKGFAVPPSGLGGGSIQPPLPRLAESPQERAAKAFRPIIVLDPGHGGMDSGAVKLGTVEKDVVLAFGHVLRDQLEKTGRYKILMTRDDDTFVPLDERRMFAERNKASLFIAIHADYAQSRARGATIFTLRDRVAKDLERSAKGKAADRALSMAELDNVRKVSDDASAVRNILADLAERDVGLTHERTDMFAKTVIENMSESTEMRSEPDQQAAFRVLKTAQFPSVLIELAYVTNRKDAENLNSDEWRAKVAQSIVAAIDNYFSHELARLPM